MTRVSLGMSALPASIQRELPEGGATATEHAFLLCVAGGSRLCLPLDTVVRVFALAALQPVPRGPSYLKGLVNLGGASVPVIDLAERVGLPAMDRYFLETSIVLCRRQGRTMGIIVETVIGLANVGSVESQLEGLFAGAGGCLAGIAVVAGHQTLIVDAAALFDIDFGGERPAC